MLRNWFIGIVVLKGSCQNYIVVKEKIVFLSSEKTDLYCESALIV